MSEWLYRLVPLWVAGAALGGGMLAGLFGYWLATRGRLWRLEAALADAERRVRDQQELRAEREAAFELASGRLQQTFGELAHRSLRVNSEMFLRVARQNLGAQQERARQDLSEREKAVESLVKPIREALAKTERQIGELEKARSEAYGSIRAQLEAMQASQQALRSETSNLVKALRRPEVRGQWGEITLRRLVEIAGMVEHCDFVEQSSEGTQKERIRPDMIVRMPDERELVVDVKTPLDAYLEAMEATDDQLRAAALSRHARKVRDRIRELASKHYWSQFPRSPEFVILFIPGDQFLTAALNENPDLLDEALRQKIILATPTSFVALLKAVAYGWRQLALAENAEEVRQLAVELYERLATFGVHLNRLGRQLSGSVGAFNSAVGSLERSVLPGARKFTELGVQTKRAIDTVERIDDVARQAIESDPTIEGSRERSSGDRPGDRLLP
ncbi:MAG: DNA recombination protein RmuC [Gammaproteobacteria bacterium]|jgi:DNA recombination protein RmuC